MILTTDIINSTVDLLLNTYQLPVQFLNKMIESFKLEDCGTIINQELSKVQKAKLVLNAKGSALFAGPKDINKELRRRIIDKWNDKDIDQCFTKWCSSSGASRVHKIRKLSELKWHNGKNWSNTFVEISQLSPVFAGLSDQSMNKLSFEDIEPLFKPPQLMPFQIELKNALIQTLNEKGDDAKCIVSLPTGGGKTRTAVEAFVEWLQPRFSEGKYLIWLAQSEELCEQAIASISQVWSSKEFIENLRVYRYFGSHKLASEDFIGGVVVCTINKLYHDIINSGEISKKILSRCGALIIDEAHRGISPMYNKLYEYSKELNGESMFPICGLTATPGRTGQTHLLSDFFKFKLYTPNLGDKFNDNPVKYFRDNGYLAKPKHVIVGTNYSIINIDLGEDNDLFDVKSLLEETIQKKLLKEIASDINRNVKIVQYLESIPKGMPSIVYCCTVDHSNLLSTVMNLKNRRSVSISSETRRPLRRKYIEQFKKGEIDFIFNYGVLTTGFDAPKTENIIICRPIFSDVLYEQIVGRGLRGPKFGGTEYCTIVDFSDNFHRYGDQLAYKRFEDFWMSPTKVID